MGQADYYEAGTWNQQCDICDEKVKANKTRLIRPYAKSKPSWVACRKCQHECNPQDFVKGVVDKQTVPIVRRPGVDKFRTQEVTYDDL